MHGKLSWMPRVSSKLSPGVAIVICLLLMTASIGLLVTYFARSQDEAQIFNEQTIVTSAINDAMTKLGDALRPNTYWDDAYNHLTDKVSPDWAVKNLGPYARDTSGVSVLLMVSERGSTFYSFVGNEPDSVAADYENDAAVKTLVHEAGIKTAVPPTIASGFVRVGDRIYLGAASQIVPNDDRAKHPLERHNVEVYLQAFGADRISKVQRDFRLSPVSMTVKPPPHGMASVVLRDAAGETIGHLWWRAATPGRTFAMSVAPFAIFIILIIGFLLWRVLRNWMLTAKYLEIKKAEAEILRQESHAKTTFIGNISHELRTPLNAILGFSDILVRQLFGPLGSTSYSEYAEHIHSSGRSLLHTINDVIELSKIEAHEKLLAVESVDANFLLKEAVEMVRGQADKKDVRLELRSLSQPHEVTTCVSASTEIIFRLLDNAVKFSHPDGIVEISIEDHQGVVIRICDHGIGIDPEAIGSLGKPFSQVEGHLSRRNGGLGLGLAICYGLAKVLNISISIESNLGQGTVVTVRLPHRASEDCYRRAAA